MLTEFILLNRDRK